MSSSLASTHQTSATPQEDWTVKQVFEWALLQAHAKADETFERESKALTEHLEAGIRELYDAKPNQPTLSLRVTSGPHAGHEVQLTPTTRITCPIGRSKGKKYKSNGLSLHQDLEVSTNHGKFTVVDGTFCFVDTGSTNGSKLDGESLAVDRSYPLKTGSVLLVGASTLEVTVS